MLLNYQSDIVLMILNTNLLQANLLERLSSFYILGLVLANLDPLCIGESTWDMVYEIKKKKPFFSY